ncbi:hypothetical protein OS493_020220 [Desmophyllum pertusum]|uniref:Uncharacterized protein n=1 Tax=Desmophyllum pertusum TaxID=174260 RepID=A0A9X0D2X9_9CNID|nr:hypothetical protein OS493_020220 [Desmophyllum pertusum]
MGDNGKKLASESKERANILRDVKTCGTGAVGYGEENGSEFNTTAIVGEVN